MVFYVKTEQNDSVKFYTGRAGSGWLGDLAEAFPYSTLDGAQCKVDIFNKIWGTVNNPFPFSVVEFFGDSEINAWRGCYGDAVNIIQKLLNQDSNEMPMHFYEFDMSRSRPNATIAGIVAIQYGVNLLP